MQMAQYVIVMHWESRNYGSKPTNPEGAAQGRFVYVAIIPWQPVNHCYKLKHDWPWIRYLPLPWQQGFGGKKRLQILHLSFLSGYVRVDRLCLQTMVKLHPPTEPLPSNSSCSYKPLPSASSSETFPSTSANELLPCQHFTFVNNEHAASRRS